MLTINKIVYRFQFSFSPYDKFTINTNAEFGAGNGTIWLSNLACTGTEEHLRYCASVKWGVADYCDHTDDVGIICRGVKTTQNDKCMDLFLNYFVFINLDNVISIYVGIAK